MPASLAELIPHREQRCWVRRSRGGKGKVFILPKLSLFKRTRLPNQKDLFKNVRVKKKKVFKNFKEKGKNSKIKSFKVKKKI